MEEICTSVQAAYTQITCRCHSLEVRLGLASFYAIHNNVYHPHVVVDIVCHEFTKYCNWPVTYNDSHSVDNIITMVVMFLI